MYDGVRMYVHARLCMFVGDAFVAMRQSLPGVGAVAPLPETE